MKKKFNQRRLALLAIIVLLIFQNIPALNLINVLGLSNSFKINVDAKATQEETQITLTTLSPEEYDSVHVYLPDESNFDSVTGQVEKVTYDEATHSLAIEWSEIVEQQIIFTLSQLVNTNNKVTVEGVVNEQALVREEHKFVVQESEDASEEEAMVESENAELEQNQEEGIIESEKQTSSQEQFESADSHSNDSGDGAKENKTEEKTVFPNVSSDIEGEKQKEKDSGDSFLYNIRVLFPDDIENYEEVVIEDEIDKRIEIKQTKVIVRDKAELESDNNGTELKELRVKVDNQHVALELTETEIAAYSGKELNLQVEAEIIENEEAKQLIKQKATVTVNNEPGINSDEVRIEVLEKVEELGTDSTVENTDKQSQEDLEKTESVQEETEKAQVDNDIKTQELQGIVPLVGDLNTDIDIAPYKATVESGKAAMYKLVLKTTGSQKLYEDSTLTVKLPITDYTQFTQDVNELEIAGVVPVYNEADHTLVYEFSDQLRAGETYEKIIKVKTENLISPNGAELNAVATLQVTDKEQTQEFVDDATVRINASSSVSVSKKYKETRLSGNVQKAPFPGSYTIWDIKVSIPKKDVGQMLLKEDSKIVITDTFSSGLTYYDVMNNTPEPTVSGRTLTWELDAPSIAEQMEADGEFFTVDLRVRLQVNNNNNLIGTTQENNVHLSTTFIDDNTISESTRDTITIVSQDAATGDIEGSWYVPVHIGPSNGNGGLANDDLKNPNPIVYDDALLAFSHGIAPLNESKPGDFKQYTTIYRIDPNLIFVKLSTPKGFYYRPNSSFPAKIPLVEQPRFNIVAQVNGQERVLVENAEINREYTRSELGLLQTDNISYIKYDFTYAPSGMLNDGRPNYYFYVTEGYTGEVVNTFNVYGHDANGNSFNYRYHQEGRDTIAGPRSATIAPRPTNQPPIATVGVELLEQNSGEVVHGENRMKVMLNNESSSTLTMSEQLESVVLLPPGVTLNTDTNATYTDNDGKTTQGQYEIISDDYNGSGRQLVKIKWDEDRIRIGKELTAELDVTISEGAPNTLIFDVYGFSGDEELRVPSTSGTSITDTILQTDEDDLNGDGITDQPRLKSGNIYTIRGQYDLQTEKWVKTECNTDCDDCENKDDWARFARTIPGGTIDYKLKLTNTTGKDISTMTLIDVLPSVGDIGITDNISRGSQFTPLMTGPITLPAEWEGKVNVYYSTAKNPKRDDLTRHTKYPETTMQLSNPDGAEEPNWIPAANVTDWSGIHSFKIELIDGEAWIEGKDMEITFSMKAPKVEDVENPSVVFNKDLDPTERAAWNSFAVATDHGQPVEPNQVGVYMELGSLEITKVEADTQEVLQGAEFKLTTDEAGENVFDAIDGVTKVNGELVTGELKELTTNEEGQILIDGLAPGTYYLHETKAPESYVLLDTPITVVIDCENMIHKETVKNSKAKGSLEVTKIDSETKEILPDAEFELRDENGNVVSSGTTDLEGKIFFSDLPLGKYQLVETKAPDGYRLLTKPIDVEIKAENLELKLEVENSKSDWELPNTGGIGTAIFYALGILLMIVAVVVLSKRNKTNE